MIIFFEGGRLGNQIFQYCGLKKICGKDRIYIYGMHSLKKSFINLDLIKSNFLIDYMIRRIGQKRFLYLSKKIGFIGYIEEKDEAGEVMFYRHPGLIKSIYFCSTIYFQSEKLLDEKTASEIELEPSIISKASRIINQRSEPLSRPYFIHIRRGDYASFPYPHASAMLPMEWYIEQIELIYAYCKNPCFIVVTDDVKYAKDYFQHRSDIYISSEKEEVDLGIMSLCDGGILSASSFSWFGAYFAHHKNPSGLFIAPKYWWGLRFGEWMPPSIKTNWITYVRAP